MKFLKILFAVTLSILLGTLIYNNYQFRFVLESNTTKKNVFEEMVFLHSVYGGSSEFPSAIQLFDSLGNSETLEPAVISSPKLVFRFTSLNCDNCYIEILSLLKSFSTSIGADNTILMGSFERINYFRLILQDQDLQLPFTIVPFGLMKNEAEKLNFPYFFILSQNGKISNIFIPNSQVPELTYRYLNEVKEIIDPPASTTSIN